jgi:hypothetical protein
VQPPRDPHDFSADIERHVVQLPTQPAAELQVQSSDHSQAQYADHPSPGRLPRVRTHAIREVVVLEVAGRLSGVIEELDRAIQLALAEGPRGVVCDLSGVLEGADPDVLEVLAEAGRHVRDWSGTPVAVACPDPRVRETLAAHHMGGQLIVNASMFSAVSMVVVTPTPAHEWLRLAPHRTALRDARAFVTHTLLAWGLDPLSLSASLVANELVASATRHTTAEVDCNRTSGVARVHRPAQLGRAVIPRRLQAAPHWAAEPANTGWRPYICPLRQRVHRVSTTSYR